MVYDPTAGSVTLLAIKTRRNNTSQNDEQRNTDERFTIQIPDCRRWQIRRDPPPWIRQEGSHTVTPKTAELMGTEGPAPEDEVTMATINNVPTTSNDTFTVKPNTVTTTTSSFT